MAKLGAEGAPHTAPGVSIGPSPQIAGLLAAGQRHHQAGRLAEAERSYRQILAIDQNHPDGLHLLGILAQQVGRSDQAVKLIRAAIASFDRTAVGDQLGSAFETRGSVEDAFVRQKRAAAYSNLGIALMAAGDSSEALRAIQHSIQIEETENAKLLFVQCVRGLASIPEGVDVRDELGRALSEPWGRPRDLARLSANLLKRDGAIGACVRRVNAAWPGCLPPREIFSAVELKEICGNRLLRSLLGATIVFDIELERFLTAARRAILDTAARSADSTPIGEDMLRFACALAQQCFVNEYIFAETDHETEQVGRLRALLVDALASGTPVPEAWVAAVVLYFPVALLPAPELLLERPWSALLARFLAQQAQEAHDKRQLKSSVPCLTPIQDEVSLAVKQQYEQNPYPRWMKASPVGRATTIEDYLRQQFPLSKLHNVIKTDGAEILIAGCGTGQHAIETARRFSRARVLAIDLSLISLCYAKRKAKELGLANVEYAQADILELGSLARSFDVIEAVGVLHHLAEPMAGWRALCSLLRPGGFMRLGLYSRVARQDLVAARIFISERGYGSSAAEIRRCREELAGAGIHTSLAKATQWVDFFSTSTCRDLLFHVQEHQFTLPEIDVFLREHQLELLGFDLPSGTLHNFRWRFPHDKRMTDLSLWHIFETEHPQTFAGMYQFWIRKP